MGKFTGTKITENRQYENPSDPTNSNYTIIFNVTATEAVIDPVTGKTLKTTLEEKEAEIAAAAKAATEAQSAAQTAQSAASAASSAATPTAFSVDAAAWTALTSPVAGRSFSAEIAAEGVTVADIPDMYFDDATYLTAECAGIILGTNDGKIVLYAMQIPDGTVSGSYFIKKGAAT